MAVRKVKTRIQNKHAIEADWLKAKNFIPLIGELIIYDKDDNCDFDRIKIGDGKTKVNDLPFFETENYWEDL